jgi:hypothetical protein
MLPVRLGGTGAADVIRMNLANSLREQTGQVVSGIAKFINLAR